MPYITSREAFQGYAHAIIVGMYTDRITATAVRKDNGGMIAVAATAEPVEGIAALDASQLGERFLFNMEKAINALPHDARVAGCSVVVALGSGTGRCTYAVALGMRDVKEKKITAEEVRAIIDAADTEKGSDAVHAEYPEHFSVDGFSVSDPVGLNGGEVSVGLVRVSCDEAFEKKCAASIAALGLRYAGVIDMRHAAMHDAVVFAQFPNTLALFVFEHETHIAIMRENAVRAIGTARAGYGMMYADIAQSFLVGIAEVKEIVRAYRAHELDGAISSRIADICDAAAGKITNAWAASIGGFGISDIIPGRISVVCADAVPELLARFALHDWFADLPVERHAAVSLHAEDGKNFLSPFDRMSADFLIRHH